MKKQLIRTNNKKEEFTRVQCWLIFFTLLILSIPLIIFLERINRAIFQIALFLEGWFVWTFIEYMLHRFWWHNNYGTARSALNKRHLHHHTHPSEISVTPMQRTIMIFICVVLIIISVKLDNYFTILAGLWTGFSGLFFMHYFLHQGLVQKVFPQLLRYHIVHHCKSPDKCYGISVTWWDSIFRTAPNKQIEISEKIQQFYFHGDHH